MNEGDEVSRRSNDPGAGTIEGLCKALVESVQGFRPETRNEVERLAAAVAAWSDDTAIEARVRALANACFYFERIGCSFDGIAYGKVARELARSRGLKDLERFACVALSSVYVDSANFEEACKCLERALVLAREGGDPFLECVAYSMSGALLKVMGCYVDALVVIDKALSYSIDTAPAGHVRFACATNGLFCAHRMHDDAAALRYMAIAAETIDNPLIDDVTRATFEYNRALYLLAQEDHETVEMLVAAARRRLDTKNPRVDILLRTAAALCDWATRRRDREARAKRDLRELYHRSRDSRIYHDDVLRALMQVHGRPQSREEAETGMAFAKELVEYTTSVKHAKFYRHMSDHGIPVPPEARVSRSAVADESATEADPLANARRWLTQEAVAPLPFARPEGGLPRAVPRDIRKHDELTAIHDDLARLRTESLKSSIRTVAYDMAENWALAAEFFDDQTGQHCFRVGRLSGLLAAEIGLDEDHCVRIEHAARLHDIGKITVNELILLKPGPLDPGELTAMRAHSEAGGFLLQHADDPTLRLAAVIARHHHEWWNGTGYPASLSGEHIPLEARIVAMADVYDALTNARPYKRAWSHRLTVEQMMCESGAHFDPRLIRPFLKVLERHVGSTTVPPSTQMHLRDMEANGLLASRRSLMAAVNGTV